MKVTFEINIEVSPVEGELNSKEQANMVAALGRILRNRVRPLTDSQIGGDRSKTGWEVVVDSVQCEPKTKA
jgi:hypothetical protein